MQLRNDLASFVCRFLRSFKSDQTPGGVQTLDYFAELFGEAGRGGDPRFEGVYGTVTQPESFRRLTHKLTEGIPPQLSTPVLMLGPSLIFPG